MGTIDYMAPEQAERAESVDYRADLYALGATLFRLLCGRAPLAAAPNLSPLARLRLLATSTPPLLRTLRADAPLELEQLIQQLLARSPDDRPPSAAHVAEQLGQFASDANLSALIRSAQQISGRMEYEIGSTHSNAPKLAASEPLQTPPRTPPNRSWRWLIAAAAGALSMAAVVLITLETQKGQVIIESLDASVTVQIAKDGQVQRSLSIVPGANSTRIAAGEYEVSLATGSDQFEIDHETLQIKRGQTVIARVRQISKTAVASNSLSSEASARTDSAAKEKVYKSKTLATWRNQLINERSFEALQDALEAIPTLTSASERQAIINEFLMNYPTTLSVNNQVDLLKQILRIEGDSHKYVEAIVTALPNVDDEKAELLSRWCLLVFQNSTYKLEPAIEKPLALWAAKFLAAEEKRTGILTPERRKLQMAAGFCIVRYLNSITLTQDAVLLQNEQSIVESLKSSSVLDYDFWLRVLPSVRDPDTGRFYVIASALAAAVEERAADCFLESTKPDQVSAATLLLLKMNDKDYQRNTMPPLRRKAEIVESIRVRLRKLTTVPEKLPKFVELDSEYTELASSPKLTLSASLFRYPPSISIRFSSMTNPCIDLLQLAVNLNASSELEAEVIQLLEVVKPSALSLASQLAGEEAARGALHWYHLTYSADWAYKSQLRFGLNQQKFDASPLEVIAVFVFSQIEWMLSTEKRTELVNSLPQAIRQTYIERQLQNLDSNHDGQFDPSELSVIKTLAGNPVLSRDQVAEKLAEIYDKAMAELDLRQRNKR